MKRFDPCFTCKLPDCDEESRHCGLNAALRLHSRMKKRGQPIPKQVQEGFNAWRQAWRTRVNAERSEGTR